MTFTVKDVQVQGPNAAAIVEMSSPDFSVLLKDLMGAAFAHAFDSGDEKERARMLAEKSAQADVPIRTRTKTFNLVKEADGWRVFLDWETDAKVDSAIEEARRLRKEKKLPAALAKLDEVLELRSEMVEAKNEHREIEHEIRDYIEKQTYIDKVTLYDLEARYYQTYLEKRVPGVEFKLKNTGDRTLKKVKVTVYFKDASGSIIHEEDYLPVLVTEFSFSGENKPLKPGYIWQQKRGKFYKAESVPNEWKEGSVLAGITDIEFDDSGRQD